MYEVFSSRLKQAMAQKGYKQADLIREAAKYGVKLGRSQVSQYVSGKTMPRIDVMHTLADILDVQLSWLEGEESGHACPHVQKIKQAR